MNIAIPVYENRVMPRFGCTRQLVIACIQHDEIVEQKQLTLTNESFGELPAILASEQVTLMICGGIHPRFQHLLRQQQIEVIWGVRGEWRQAMQAYLAGTLQSNPQYCRQHRQHHGSHGHRQHQRRK
jgi:predicted Fe-Mo cluster-binding NifX family protein